MNTTALVMLLVGLLFGLAIGAAAMVQVARARRQAADSEGRAALAAAHQDVERARAEQASVRSDADRAWAQASEARAEAERAKAETERTRAEVSQVKALVSDGAAQVAQYKAVAAEAQAERADVAAQLTGMIAERDAAVARAEELAADRKSMENSFKALSHESLERQGKQADAVAEARFKATAELMTPVAESLKLMNDRINQVERERASATAEMREQIRNVMTTSESLRKETNALVSALRKPQVRGTWGETQLKRVAELAGMVERCDFDLQTSTTTEDGVLRPDMKVNLADGKVLFVDSKVPLSAFLDAYEAGDDDLRDAHLATFARHVRTHIDQLSGKQYWRLEKASPEFTILFLPSEAFLQAALEQMPDLHDYSARRNITLATPSILIPLLRAVAHGWQQAALAESAEQVAALARDLYDRLGTMGNHFDKVGRGLTQAVKAYNATLGSLESRVLVTARKFNDLQVTTGELPAGTPVRETPKQLTATELTASIDSDELGELEALRGRTRVEATAVETTTVTAQSGDERARVSASRTRAVRARAELPEREQLLRGEPSSLELVEEQAGLFGLDEQRRSS